MAAAGVSTITAAFAKGESDITNMTDSYGEKTEWEDALVKHGVFKKTEVGLLFEFYQLIF
jgi:hypothetical protein